MIRTRQVEGDASETEMARLLAWTPLTPQGSISCQLIIHVVSIARV
jgi:hypothetical protein